MKNFFRAIRRLMLGTGILFLVGSATVFGASNALPMPNAPVDRPESVGAGGPTFKYKRVSGPMKFGGDILVWGFRAFGGRKDDPKLGISGSTGTLNGKSLQMDLRMAGFTLENSWRSDSRLKWRMTLGGGTYDLHNFTGSYTVNKGTFAYFEPMFVGVVPMNRHLAWEIAGGYTFAGTTGVKIEGPCLEVNLLFGRY